MFFFKKDKFFFIGLVLIKYIPPFVALPSKTTRKSDWALTVTCPGYQSGLAVFRVVADICQTCKKIKFNVFNSLQLNLKKETDPQFLQFDNRYFVHFRVFTSCEPEIVLPVLQIKTKTISRSQLK